MTNPDITPEQREMIQKSIAKYGDCFATCPQETKRVKDYEFKLEPLEDKVIYDRPGRYSPEKLEIISKQIDEMLSNGIIRKSSSPHNSRAFW